MLMLSLSIELYEVLQKVFYCIYFCLIVNFGLANKLLDHKAVF